MSFQPPFLKGCPSSGVVGFAVAAVEGGGVGDGALPGATGQGVVRDGAGDGTRFHVLDLVPFRAGEAYAGPALAAGEDDATIPVVPGVVFVLPQDGELDPVDRAQFVESEAQGYRRQDVDFHEGLPPLVIRPEGAVPLPFRGQIGESAVFQPRIVLRPALLKEGLVPGFFPELGVVGGEAVEQEGSGPY